LKLGAEVERSDDAREIERRVREHLPLADAETVRVVAALTGLLGAVAYADRITRTRKRNSSGRCSGAFRA